MKIISRAFLSMLCILTIAVVIVAGDACENFTSATTRAGHRFDLVIDTSKSLSVTQPTFVSLCIAQNDIRKKMKNFDFGSEKLVNMAAALSPAKIRFGGTYANFLLFDPNKVWASSIKGTPLKGQCVTKPERDASHKEIRRFIMSPRLWNKVWRFCDRVGWEIMWGFNNFLWKENCTWDPIQVKEFLKYNAKKGVKIPLFQLGNEPQAYKKNYGVDISPETLADEYQSFRDVLAEFPEYKDGQILGPDVVNLNKRRNPRQYLDRFLRAGGCDMISEVGLHHYYIDGRKAKVKDYLDPAVMETLKSQLDYAFNITWDACKRQKPISLTETSSAFAGGTGNLSDAYADGFLWLDKLGFSAKYGVSHVFRQTFYGGKYSLVDKQLNPLPDYWLTLLYKRLVEGPVFDVIKTSEVNTNFEIANLRVYAHCARKGYYNYPDGALVVYFLNVGNEQVYLSLDNVSNSERHLFLLTAGDEQGLNSKLVKLNGKVIEMNGPNIPDLDPEPHCGDILVSGQSFGFIVIPDADVQLCKTHNKKNPFANPSKNPSKNPATATSKAFLEDDSTQLLVPSSFMLISILCCSCIKNVISKFGCS